MIIFRKSTVKSVVVVVFKMIFLPGAEELNCYYGLRLTALFLLWVFYHQHSKAFENKHSYYFGIMNVRKRRNTYTYSTCLLGRIFHKMSAPEFLYMTGSGGGNLPGAERNRSSTGYYPKLESFGKHTGFFCSLFGFVLFYLGYVCGGRGVLVEVTNSGEAKISTHHLLVSTLFPNF